MNAWNKIVLGIKFVFGGFEAAIDYLLKLLNEILKIDNVAGRVQQVREFVVTILSYMKKYEKYCPAIWVDDYLKLMSIIQLLVDVFEDGKVDPNELEKAIEAVRDDIEEWMK